MRRKQVERCLSTTGMTIKEWGGLNGVAPLTMYYWMSRFRKEEPELFGASNKHSRYHQFSSHAVPHHLIRK